MTEQRATPVVLESFPVRLFAAAAEQWEAMLREYALRGFGGAAQSYGDDEIARAGNALAVVEQSLPGPAKDLPDHGTMSVEVPIAGDFALLQGILDDAWRMARSGELLVLPPLPEVVAFRNWLCDQITGQAAGATPGPWEFSASAGSADGSATAEWDRALAPPDETAWIVGDDHNLIVGASPAALTLLGWTEDDLVGQRLLTVIPPHLRERHIAGFTRSVVSGGGSLLGKPLAVPALARHGGEIPIVLTLTRHGGRHGRTVYLALLEPAPAG